MAKEKEIDTSSRNGIKSVSFRTIPINRVTDVLDSSVFNTLQDLNDLLDSGEIGVEINMTTEAWDRYVELIQPSEEVILESLKGDK